MRGSIQKLIRAGENNMIAQLKGKIISKTATELIIDCNGVGYQVIISLNTSNNLPEEGADVTIMTLLIPREDAIVLYGFWSKAERELFKTLISISGIGPKSAIGILSSATVEELQHIVIQGNLNALQKLPGIGKKTAERLLLELKDKIDRIGDFDSSSVGFEQNLMKQEALSALLTLGYSRVVAEKSIKKALDEIGRNDLTAEKLIKLSLKYAIM
ncbi:Holliday junction branch migration protein RuvA [Bacteroidetes/Chlorobi group bacterium ChocPot_Mid]|jgi:Holliday junction DNA helicase RuvA|nr:MAG: Holliday junction branch migration protein RuvA [Bacteroidetes/Chlorobi group bacterium ChocPot_Mid]